jgi:hypothetical protein
MKSRIMLAVLGCVLAACSDQSRPLAPDAAGSVSLSQGGAPTEIPLTPPVLDPISSAVCGFPVLLQATGKQKVLEFPNGRTIVVFPKLTVIVTNGNTGRTVTRSQTGAFHINPLPNGDTELVLTGNNSVTDDVIGFFVFLSGRFTVVFGPDGSLVQGLEGNGRRVDVCQLLA